jgi:hypothetical protein
MKYLQSFIPTILFLFSGLIFLNPVNAQNTTQNNPLNNQLRDALCRQNWAGAIAVIDRMKKAAPSYVPILNDYRAFLVNLRNSRARLAGWPTAAYCAGENPTALPANIQPVNPPNTPNPTNTPTNINNPQPIPQNQPIPNNNQTVPTFNDNPTGANQSIPMGVRGEAPNPSCRWVSLTTPQGSSYINGYWACGQ